MFDKQFKAREISSLGQTPRWKTELVFETNMRNVNVDKQRKRATCCASLYKNSLSQ